MFKKVFIWNKSIFFRLIFTFLIVMIPLYSVGINIYNRGVDAIKAEILNSRISQIAFFKDNFDKEIQRIKLLQSDLLLSGELNRLSNSREFMDEYEKADLTLRIYQRLIAIKNSSAYIQDATAIVPSIGKVISVWNNINKMEDHDFIMLKAYDNSTHSQTLCLDNEMYINGAFPSNYTSGDLSPLYAIDIKFSSGELRKALSQFDYNIGEGGTLLFDSVRKFLITTGTDKNIVLKMQDYVEKQLVSNDRGKGQVVIDGRKYLVIYNNSEYMGLTLCNFIPEDQIFKFLNKYQVWFWLFSIVATVIIIIFSFFMYQFIQQPLKKLIKAFKRLEGGNMNFSIKHKYDDEFEYVYERFNDMVKNLNKLIEQSYKQKIMLQHAELKQLQAQINPHFLYNSFFIFYTMIRDEEYDTLERFALQLGEYFQFITRSASSEVTLSQEMAHAKTYCDIQAMRFLNRIRIEFEELPAGYSDMMVPRLIAQPLIENAFKHGLEKKEDNSLLHIGFEASDSTLRIVIEDSGEGMSDQEIEELNRLIDTTGEDVETTGILNIHRRIRLRFGNGNGIKVSRSKLGGLRVCIKLPVQKEWRNGHV